ncbi:MAG: sugar ABC transporter substrate-binding protein [Candidatus Ancaeobacter aquaticus]|nr:sugar ABC transporter substrate-binding protein [Candidatus Ancaeobacter aquaticus]
MYGIRKLLLVGLCICVMMCYGCTKKDDGKIHITYQTIETLPKQRKLLKKLIAEFERQYPVIKVHVQISPTGFRKLHTQFAANNAPDVFYYVSDRLYGLVHKKKILSLNQFAKIDNSVNFDTYFPETVEASTIDGLLYLMPYHFSTDILFYNKDMFDMHSIPYPTSDWSWDTFMDVAQKLTKKQKDVTIEYGTLQPRPTLVIRSFGGKFFNHDLTDCIVDTEQTKEALEFLKELRNSGVVPSQAQIRDVEMMDGVSLFSTGKIGMLVGRTYMLVEFGSIDTFDWDVTYVPKGKERFSRLAVGGNCINSSSQHPEEAWKLVKFLSSDAAMQLAAESRNCVPAIKSVAYSKEFMHYPPKDVSIFVDSINSSETENPGLANWFEYVDKVIGPDVEKVIYDQLTIQEAVSDISKRGNDILKKDETIH